MVQLIVGERGKGKTKHLLDGANEAVTNATGNIVYLDKNSKHMYELNNKIRLIDISQFPVKGYDQLEGFICGVISQDHDIEKIYIDSFSTLADIKDVETDLKKALGQIEFISSSFNVDFVVSISNDKSELDASLQEKIITAL
ncbi:MAG: twitching motility protein PilT [Lachnospiraceae bacterium]|nr:twitching motility protein PilT [Lachnospiraceae bacterium]